MDYLDKFEQDGVIYVPLVTSICPKCEEPKSTPIRDVHLWKHKQCNGDVYIGDNGYILCRQCGESFRLGDISFECPMCNTIEDYYVSVPGETSIADVLSSIVYHGIPDIQWLRRLTISLDEQL